MEEIIDKIIEIMLIILFVGLIILICYGMYNHTKYCENNPNDETCQVRETQVNTNNSGGVKCGWVFGHGFRCGIGF